MLLDLTILDNEQEALAKITEALAKVYFDNVLKRGFNIDPIAEAYKKAFNLCPNYRLILKDKPGFDKYKHISKEMGEITSLPIKPKNRFEFNEGQNQVCLNCGNTRDRHLFFTFCVGKQFAKTGHGIK